MTLDFTALTSPNLLSTVVGIAFTLLVIMLYARRGELDCIDLITARGKDGVNRLSRTAIGQFMGIIVAVWAPVYTTLDGKLDGAVLMGSLAYLGGVEAYSTYLRWKDSQNERQVNGSNGKT